MKKTIYILMLSFHSLYSIGQTNLVPNPSFEDTIKCPVSVNQTITTTFWKSYGGTSDYYNSCRNVTMCGVSTPSNAGGYQIAATGQAYCGLITYADPILVGLPNVREYIGTYLTSPLVTGIKYYVSLKVCLAEGNCDGPLNNSFDFYMASNKIGAKFIKYNLPYLSAPPVFNSAQVFTNLTITDSINWTTIKGSFVADSNYNQIMIGNFFDDVNTNTLIVGSPPQMAYYFIDDVVVSTDSLTQIISINEFHNDKKLLAYPNPASDFISIKVVNYVRPIQFILFDAVGQIILSQKVSPDDKISLSNINNGLYFLQVISDGRTYYDKLIVRH